MSAYSDAVNALGPDAYWRLGEASGITAHDETEDYDGTYVNTPTLGEPSLVPSDTVNKAVGLASASLEYVTMDHSALRYTTPFTILLWFKSSTDAHQNPYSTMYDWDNGGIFLLALQTSNHFMFGTKPSGGTYAALEGTSDIIDGSGRFLAATLDSGTGRLYVDGTEERNGALPTPTYGAGTVDGPYIGRRYNQSPSYYVNGLIDEVAVFGYALSGPEIAHLSEIANAVRTTVYACANCEIVFGYNASTLQLLYVECTGLPGDCEVSFTAQEFEGDTWTDTFSAIGSKECPYDMYYVSDGEGGIKNIDISVQMSKT